MGSLSPAMREMLERAQHDWGDLPRGVSIGNRTLDGLEQRGYVETRLHPDETQRTRRHLGRWQWRRNPFAPGWLGETIDQAKREMAALATAREATQNDDVVILTHREFTYLLGKAINNGS